LIDWFLTPILAVFQLYRSICFKIYYPINDMVKEGLEMVKKNRCAEINIAILFLDSNSKWQIISKL
jgi:hypothetical protein